MTWLDWIWVIGGAVVTLVLAAALVYWTIQDLVGTPRPPEPPPPDQDARNSPTATA